jgi:DNA-binding transcriptional regulator YdaS (Cro superfamily)
MRRSRAPNLRKLMAEAVRIVGLQAVLAARLGKSQQLVSSLCTRARGISPRDAIAIHRITGGQVPASLLRPDLWRRPEHLSVDNPAR